MSTEQKELDRFNAPFNREIIIQELVYENGFPMLKLMIKEGKRFTTLELDPPTAERWGKQMADWAAQQDLSSLPDGGLDGE